MDHAAEADVFEKEVHGIGEEDEVGVYVIDPYVELTPFEPPGNLGGRESGDKVFLEHACIDFGASV